MNDTDFPEYGRQCELLTPWRGYHRASQSARSLPFRHSWRGYNRHNFGQSRHRRRSLSGEDCIEFAA